MQYKTIEDLLTILQERGLELRDRDTAKHYLSTVGHHRLTAFYEHFYTGHKTFDSSIPATIDDVVHLYSFDRRLRLLLIGPLEKIEVALRALIIMEVGDFLQRLNGGNVEIRLFDRGLYDLSSSQSRRNFDLAKQGCERGARSSWTGPFSHSKAGKGLSNDDREAAFRKYYDEMPAWKVLQTASFGPLTHIYSILRQEIANPISQRFNLSRVVLTTTLFALKELRNSCAHHEPVWNWDARKRSVQLLFPKAFVDAAALKPANENEYKLYPYCAIIHILLSFLSHGNSTWHRRLKKLVNEYNTMYSASMGFPDDWQSMPFWCVPDVARSAGYTKLRSRVLNQTCE
jgi:abortive infection bacteriophage resistance protein